MQVIGSSGRRLDSVGRCVRVRVRLAVCSCFVRPSTRCVRLSLPLALLAACVALLAFTHFGLLCADRLPHVELMPDWRSRMLCDAFVRVEDARADYARLGAGRDGERTGVEAEAGSLTKRRALPPLRPSPLHLCPPLLAGDAHAQATVPELYTGVRSRHSLVQMLHSLTVLYSYIRVRYIHYTSTF